MRAEQLILGILVVLTIVVILLIIPTSTSFLTQSYSFGPFGAAAATAEPTGQLPTPTSAAATGLRGGSVPEAGGPGGSASAPSGGSAPRSAGPGGAASAPPGGVATGTGASTGAAALVGAVLPAAAAEPGSAAALMGIADLMAPAESATAAELLAAVPSAVTAAPGGELAPSGAAAPGAMLAPRSASLPGRGNVPVTTAVMKATILLTGTMPVANARANLRAGPGTDFARVGGVYVGQSLEIVGQTTAGDWYQLADGSWIAAFLVDWVTAGAPYVTPVPALPQATPSAAR